MKSIYREESVVHFIYIMKFKLKRISYMNFATCTIFSLSILIHNYVVNKNHANETYLHL